MENDATETEEELKNNIANRESNLKEEKNLEKTDNPLLVYDNFTELCNNNIDYFKCDQTNNGQRLHEAFVGLIDHIKNARNLVGKIQEFVDEYDFDEKVKGNGYRSFLRVVNECIKNGIKLAENIKQNRSYLFFRKGWYMKEVEACNHLLASLCTCLSYLLILREWSEKGDLFPSGIHSAEELLSRGETINQYCFYGRCLGFQFCDSMKGALRFISTCMAGFSESYYSQANRLVKTTNSVWTSGKYFLDPELRARRIVNISQNASVDFCKSFWFLAEGEIMYSIPSLVGHSIKINKVISIPPEPLHIRSIETGELIEIPIPTSHFGSASINARLLCSNRREGIIGESQYWRKPLPPSKGLIIHCHGGGFVAQSSKSHELYLRSWAVALDTPILSIDYSLAPEAPFPRALEEVFYSYCWALENCNLLGSTCEKIILAGDSAGANLNIGATLKCIELGIRKPDGLFIAYCPVLVNFIPSPARMLCLMDPLLPFGFMMRCLKAYACPSPDIIKANIDRKKQLDEIKNANYDNNFYTFDTTVVNGIKENPKSKTSLSSPENSNWEHIQIDDGYVCSPVSDRTSDTFASASYHSQTVENTELISHSDTSSCISLEEDSQPITKMPIESDKSVSTFVTGSNNSQKESDQYVSSFLEKYVIDTSSVEAKENTSNILKPSAATTLSEENLVIETGKELITSDHIHTRINKAAGRFFVAISSTIGKFTTSNEISTPRNSSDDMKNLDALIARSPSDEFVFEVPKDPYLSPYWAKNEVLEQFPPTKFLTTDMDPCLDDCVMFAKKLKRLGNEVTLDIIEGLPHGFLSFSMISKDAHDGSQTCIKRIAELLNVEIS